MGEALPGRVYRIETERFVLRCFHPRDAQLVKAAIDASLPELKRWMEWAKDEPQTLAQKVDLLRRFRARFDLGEEFAFGIFDRDETAVLGGAGFHRRAGRGGREIGCWVATEHAGRGIATEATAALVQVGFVYEDLERIELHCSADNVRSARIAERLGFTHDGTLRGRMRGPDDEPRDEMVWSLLRAEYPQTPAARARIIPYDVLGRRVDRGGERA